MNMRWHEKSRSHDLLFCTNHLCNVLTFRSSLSPLCPKCDLPGSIARYAKTLRTGERIEEEKRRRESEAQQTS